jgi:hypothetical protein
MKLMREVINGYLFSAGDTISDQAVKVEPGSEKAQPPTPVHVCNPGLLALRAVNDE